MAPTGAWGERRVRLGYFISLISFLRSCFRLVVSQSKVKTKVTAPLRWPLQDPPLSHPSVGVACFHCGWPYATALGLEVLFSYTPPSCTTSPSYISPLAHQFVQSFSSRNPDWHDIQGWVGILSKDKNNTNLLYPWKSLFSSEMLEYKGCSGKEGGGGRRHTKDLSTRTLEHDRIWSEFTKNILAVAWRINWKEERFKRPVAVAMIPATCS